MIGENWLKVALTAMTLGVGLYLIPLGMIAVPDLIALAEAPRAALLAALRLGAGLAAISWGLVRRKHAALRVAALGLGTALVLWPL